MQLQLCFVCMVKVRDGTAVLLDPLHTVLWAVAQHGSDAVAEALAQAQERLALVLPAAHASLLALCTQGGGRWLYVGAARAEVRERVEAVRACGLLTALLQR